MSNLCDHLRERGRVPSTLLQQPNQTLPSFKEGPFCLFLKQIALPTMTVFLLSNRETRGEEGAEEGRASGVKACHRRVLVQPASPIGPVSIVQPTVAVHQSRRRATGR